MHLNSSIYLENKAKFHTKNKNKTNCQIQGLNKLYLVPMVKNQPSLFSGTNRQKIQTTALALSCRELMVDKNIN